MSKIPKNHVLLLLCHTFFVQAISRELLIDTAIDSTSLEPLRPVDLTFQGFVDNASFHLTPNTVNLKYHRQFM